MQDGPLDFELAYGLELFSLTYLPLFIYTASPCLECIYCSRLNGLRSHDVYIYIVYLSYVVGVCNMFTSSAFHNYVQ